MHGLVANLDANRQFAPAIRVSSFNVKVRLVLSYAAEVWAPDVICALQGFCPGRRGREVTSVHL